MEMLLLPHWRRTKRGGAEKQRRKRQEEDSPEERFNLGLRESVRIHQEENNERTISSGGYKRQRKFQRLSLTLLPNSIAFKAMIFHCNLHKMIPILYTNPPSPHTKTLTSAHWQITKGLELFQQTVLYDGVRQNRIQPSTWKMKAGQFPAYIGSLSCLKKDTQGINCCYTTNEEERLTVFNIIKEFRPIKTYGWTD